MDIQAPWLIQWLAAVLWALPAPTAAWASIIGSIAWPLTIAVMVFRFRRYIRAFLNTIAGRLVTDHVKIGPFELTPNSEVIRLDGDEVALDADHTKEDLHIMEELFEFIASPSGEDKIRAWVNHECGTELSLVDFLTEPPYADLRARAFHEMKGEET